MNRTGPRLSLGIPVYNGAAYLAQLFDCLRAQTFTEYEAIISDNASIDATEQICRRMTASDSRFRYWPAMSASIGAAAQTSIASSSSRAGVTSGTAPDESSNGRHTSENLLIGANYRARASRCWTTIRAFPFAKPAELRWSARPASERSATMPSRPVRLIDERPKHPGVLREPQPPVSRRLPARPGLRRFARMRRTEYFRRQALGSGNLSLETCAREEAE